ncbi:MAG: cytochrome c5 family protein [Psychrobium sp.]|nr:cytochrome c5 family protein [Psychrobium sp.]
MKSAVSKVVLGLAVAMAFGVSASDLSNDAIKKRIAPVGNVYLSGAVVAAPAAPTGPRTGAQVYQATCFACHGTGAAGAPIKGNADAWAPRLAQGMDVLFDHALNGFNAMPAKGTCMNCSDDELKATIEYMVKGL